MYIVLYAYNGGDREYHEVFSDFNHAIAFVDTIYDGWYAIYEAELLEEKRC